MTEKRKRIIAALVCLGLVTAAAAPAALAERSDTAGRTDAEQRTQIASQTEETRGGRGAGSEDGSARCRPAEAAEPENAIGKAAAKEAALADAGLNADQVERLRARVSDKDGTTVYRVSFVCGGQKYSYKIDPMTGEVLDKTVSEASERAGHSGHKQHNGTDGSAETQLPTV